ncbi:MAG: permease, partial [Pseudomonadota bacterium]
PKRAPAPPRPPAPVVEESSCCASESGKTDQSTPLSQRLGDGVRFTFVDLVEDIAPWLLIGLGLAALIQVFVPTSFLTQWGGGFLAFAVMAVIGVPMYICATASTPIAAGLLFSGVSPGAVLVFMLAGPATNMATMGLVWKELGRRALAAYLTGVVVVAFAFGYFTNWAADFFAIDFDEQVTEVAQMVPTPIAMAATAALALLMIRGLWAKYGPRRAAECH